MTVRLISITESLITEADLSPEELITYIARVSNPSNQLNSETSDRLIAYLIRNKHWSPFEMVDMTVEIVTSRGIAQQILRHRSFSFQEFSQRYARANEMEPIQLRYQADQNRQSSTDEVSEEHAYHFNNRIQRFIQESQLLYNDMLNVRIAKECARFILPLTTQTKIYMKGSIRSWIHYLQLRTDQHTQLEHRQVAELVSAIFSIRFPNIFKALHEV